MSPADFAELQGYMQAIAAYKAMEFELAGCVGKSAFEYAGQARMAIRPHTPASVQPYRCRFCRKWHIGGHGR